MTWAESLLLPFDLLVVIGDPSPSMPAFITLTDRDSVVPGFV